VAIGRAITRRPLIYLLDEPLSALDALLRLEMRAELKRLQRELGRTVVYVTHDQVEALSMADRICVLRAGRVQQIAPPEVIYGRPANTFVARTVGSPPINLIPVRDASANGGGLRHAAFRVAAAGRVGVDGEVILGVRPEDVKLGTEAKEPVVDCDVIAVEPLGGETIVDLDLAGQIIKATVPPTRPVAGGDRVPVEFDLRRSHLFDADGEALQPAGALAGR
jgi:ABC-type sugar transport system ATPase subunit